MSKNVTKEEIQLARRVLLAQFLNAMYPGELQRVATGHYRKADMHYVKVNEGISGYMDWSNQTSGNSIEYLQNYMGISFVDAVKMLCGFDEQVAVNPERTENTVAANPQLTQGKIETRSGFVLPARLQGKASQLYAYLIKTRKIPCETVNMLIKRNLLYQAANHPGCYNNIVFVSTDRDYYEMRGTNTEKSFHRSIGRNGDECWYLLGDAATRPDRIYITEGAIDAVSLFVLHPDKTSCYAAIGGAGKQRSVDRLKTLKIPVIIATDNDTAGDECRQKNPDCQTIRPRLHDWNDDLREKFSFH